MKASDLLARGALSGALAGLIAALTFGAAMVKLGMPSTIIVFAYGRAAIGAEFLQLILATLGGAGFGVIVWKQRFGAGEMLFWGMAYGILKWFAVPLTLLPLLLHGTFRWSLDAAQAAIPCLFGYLLYGAYTSLALAALRPEALARTGRIHAVLLRGAVAGVASIWVLALILKAQGRTLEFMALSGPGAHPAMRVGVVIVGALAGMGFSLLYPSPTGSGPGLVRGTMYGFFWWVAGGLTVTPLIAGSGLAWSLAAARVHFVTLPGYLLGGAAVALFYRWVTSFVRLLFSDEIRRHAEEGLGARGLHLTSRGAFAGLIGGLLFTIIMVRMGELPTVARLIGSSSPWTGFTVHLIIAEFIGASYGLFFARQSYDIGSGLGWGLSYGFFWWVLGPLTLAPMLLGAPSRWTAAIAAGLLPALVGHLLYGAGLGVTFHLLEARYSPWWIPHTHVEASAAARRREQVLTSAPALWALVVVIALTLPILLA
ncbi:MAG TPA: hypothetical protein VFP86_17845 [bacterium]|nr:hypothetical protein [bacterium]